MVGFWPMGHRFEKGHPPYPRKDGGVGGVSREFRERQSSIALRVRELESERGLLVDWLWELKCGRDPDAPKGVNGEDLSAPVDMGHRRWAAKQLLDRGYGLVPQHVILEAEVRAALGVVTASVSSEAIKNMPPEKLAALRAMLGSVVSPGTSSPVLMPAPATAHVVDVESGES